MPPSTPTSRLDAAILPVTHYQQNCTLLWDRETKLGAIVDPGGDTQRIKAAVTQVGMTPQKILITHGHTDHAGGAAELAEHYAIKVEGPHVADKFLLDGLAKRGEEDGVHGRNLTPDRWLADGDTVEVAGHTFQVLHCPGHSPGSVVFFDAGQRFALVGDVLFSGSIGRTDMAGYGDGPALIHAIKTKLLPLGDDIAFICGHGPGSTFGAERETNPYLKDA